MIEGLAQVVPMAQGALLVGLMILLRVGAAVALMPAFGEQMIPMRLRLGVAVAFSLIVFPMVEGPVRAAQGPVLWRAAIEVAAGLIMGFGLRLFVHALQIAGAMAAQATSLSQMLGANVGEPMTAIGQILLVGGLALALLLGLHVRLAEYLVMSYQLFPPGVGPDPGIVATWGIARVARAFALAFSLAGPFVLAGFVYNLALGVINRAMPQLMVAMVGAPAITAGGLLLLLLAAPEILWIWQASLYGFMAAPGGR
jgi:flagellar biosynthetic protein FliR